MLLTVSLDGEWTARDLAAVLDSLEALAGFVENGNIERLGLAAPNVRDIGDGTFSIYPGIPSGHLRIARMAYNSPGSIDLLGVAKTSEQIRLFLQYLMDLWVHRNDRALDREERAIEIAKRKIELLQKLSGDQPALSEFARDDAADPLVAAVLQRKIVGVTTKPDQSEA